MALIPVLRSLVLSFLPVQRTLAHKICIAAFGRVQEDRQEGYEFGIALMFKEMRTHTSILSTCRRVGAGSFGHTTTVAQLKRRLRLVEEIYLSVGCTDEETRLDFAPKLPVFSTRARSTWETGRGLHVGPFGAHPDNALYGFRLRLLCSNGYYM